MVIKQAFFQHKGGKYNYKVHEEKLKELCYKDGFLFLKDYLYGLFDSCPHDYFNRGPRSSLLRFKITEDLSRMNRHEVSSLAGLGLNVNKERFPDRHSQVQTFMLENDKKTVAMEVPIWLYQNELGCYQTVFKSKEVLTGHIDILRIENDKIWIWDYKPNANKEKYAATQTFFYAYMLSKRTGIPLSSFLCGYFDHSDTFVFKPEDKMLHKLNKQATLITE